MRTTETLVVATQILWSKIEFFPKGWHQQLCLWFAKCHINLCEIHSITKCVLWWQLWEVCLTAFIYREKSPLEIVLFSLLHFKHWLFEFQLDIVLVLNIVCQICLYGSTYESGRWVSVALIVLWLCANYLISQDPWSSPGHGGGDCSTPIIELWGGLREIYSFLYSTLWLTPSSGKQALPSWILGP